jgi:histidine ammonia-lyase
MGMTAALKGRQVADFTRSCIAIELLVAAQALDCRQPTRAGKGPQAAYELIRSKIPTMEKDRELHRDISAVSALIDSGELLNAVRAATRTA